MSAEGRSVPAWAWLGLLAALVLDFWLRAHTFGPTLRDRLGLQLWPVSGVESEPLDCDESAYAYIGRRLVHGDVLYRDVTENKPPLGYWIYTLAVAVGGAQELTIRVMPIPMVLATIALLWWIALRLAGPTAACLAAGIYAVASTDPYLYGNGANLEHAMNLFSVASLVAMVWSWPRAGRAGLVAAGAFVGLASLVKQPAAVHLPLYALALWLRERQAGPDRNRLSDLIALGLGFAAVWIVAIGILVAQGAGAAAFDDIVRYGGALAADTPADPHAPPFLIRWVTGNADPEGKLPWPFGPTKWLVWWGTGTWPLWLATLPSLAWLLVGPTSGPRRLSAGWTLSAWLQAALPRLFWAHYYLLPLPGIALCVAVLLDDALALCRPPEKTIEREVGGRPFARPPRPPNRRGARLLWTVVTSALIAALGWTAFIHVRDYLLVRPQELTVRYKGGGQWIAQRQLGRMLGRRARIWPSPRLFVWGWQSPLYLYSGLDGVTPHFFADPLLKAFAESDHPLIRPRIERIIRDLRARPPELIFVGDPPFPALRAFLIEHGYRRSRLGFVPPGGPSSPDMRGLWVEPRRFEQFEGTTSLSAAGR
jgi:4-amino-4-deoxy-L-arabinose transferase-like glycosyltransferase